MVFKQMPFLLMLDTLYAVDKRLSSILCMEVPPPPHVVINRYQGRLDNRYIAIESIYFDTASKLLYMDLKYKRFVSTHTVSESLHFHRQWHVISKDGRSEDDTEQILMEIDGSKVTMKEIYAEYPFKKVFDGSINPGFEIQEFDTQGRKFLYVPLTYSDVKNIFQGFRQTAKLGECSIGENSSYLIIAGNKVEVFANMSYMTYHQDERNRWASNSPDPESLKSRKGLLSVVGGCGGWEVIKKMEINGWFDENIGPETKLCD